MDFDFSQEQYMFQESVRDFLKENGNFAKVHEKSELAPIDQDFWDKLAALGVFAIRVPEEHGGLGLSLVDLSLVFEELGRALVPSLIGDTILASDVLVRFGNEEQKSRYLPAIAEGRLKVSCAVVETEAGFDAGDIAVHAEQAGNQWELSGRKILVAAADEADLLVVALRFGAGDELGLALVERAAKGVQTRAHTTLDLTGQFHEVSFDHVQLAPEHILGGAPSSEALEALLEAGGVVAAAQMTGISSKVLDDVIAYANQRTQFGVLIGTFQAIKHRCADMAVAIDASRSAAYYAAWALSESSPDRARAVSIAKSYCGDTARFVCGEGIQLHGGIGFTWELGTHLYLRRAKLLEHSYGDAVWHRERVLTETLDQLSLGSGR